MVLLLVMFDVRLMFCAAIFDDVLKFHVLIMICAININQSTNTSKNINY